MMNPNSSSPLPRLSVNDNTYNAIISEVTNSSSSPIPQPVMIIGQEGSGKTTLLKRIYNSDLGSAQTKLWIDGRFIFSSDDIISKAKHSEASVILIDDIDFYLTRCSYDEQFRLRKFLYNEGAPMMISSASKVLPALTEYEAPFFEGLKICYLPLVSSVDFEGLYSDGNTKRAITMMNFLPPTIKSLEIVNNILTLNNDSQADTTILLSIFSEKYRQAYQNLPPNSQHILNAFEADTLALTITEIRNKTGLKTSILTAYLKSLETLGVITVDKTVKRNTKYSMRDPLFNLWLSQSVQP